MIKKINLSTLIFSLTLCVFFSSTFAIIGSSKQSDFKIPIPVRTPKWKFKTGGAIHFSSPSIGKDGTIYVGSEDSYLYAINPDKTLKWKFKIPASDMGQNYIMSSPAIGKDGTIYIGRSPNASLCAINPDGTQKWVCNICKKDLSSIGSPAISNDGIIYVGGLLNKSGYLCAVDSKGNIKWQFEIDSTLQSSPSPTIGSDGTIYIGDNNGDIYAVNSHGTKKWKYTVPKVERVECKFTSSFAIAEDGTVYAICRDGNLYAINPKDGKLKWKFRIGEVSTSASPVIGTDDTIYVGGKTDGKACLYGIDPSGKEKTCFIIIDKENQSGVIDTAPIIGNDGTIYIGGAYGIKDGFSGYMQSYLYAINLDGSIKWKTMVDEKDEIFSSPVIGDDGTVYVGSEDSYLYAINCSATGLANSVWPKFRKNQSNTGSAE
jgi:outer membrane protein assembly factor BamB